MIFDKCAEEVTLYLKFLWCFQSFGLVSKKDKKLSEKVDRLIAVRLTSQTVTHEHV
jgi:hypothetical protein